MAVLRDEEADYDEFDALEGHAAWAGLEWTGRPEVRRRSMEVAPGQRISMLAWGDSEPELVFLHGGGQNAHTWDTVIMAIGRPAVAVDLPGHGHSSWRDDRDYWPWSNAAAVATAMDEVAPHALGVVGMSLGGLTTIRLAASRPDLAPRAVVVDVTPGVMAQMLGLTTAQQGPVAIVGGPPEYDSFDDMLAALGATMPGRPLDSLRPGLRHNARQRNDGKWTWIHDLSPRATSEATQPAAAPQGFDGLWDDLASIGQPIMLVKGGASGFVGAEDVDRFQATAPRPRVEVVDGAGHAVQSSHPVQLAALVESFVSEGLAPHVRE
jgi:pimeloyl-ACP methyl ester carboxylesterase